MIILASTSITRQAMLTNAGVPFVSERPEVDERTLAAQNPHWSPENVAKQLACAKAIDVSIRHPEAIVIGADQVLALGNEMFSKPTDTEDCIQKLKKLRGQTHKLISGVACAKAGTILWAETDHATLTMRNFTDVFLHDYVARNGTRCMSSVGGYQIEGPGLQLFESIEGDYFTILGLPLLPLLAQLRQAGEINS